MPWPQTGVTQYHAQVGLPDKGRAIKVFVVSDNWDLVPLDCLTVWPGISWKKKRLRAATLFVKFTD